MWKPDRTHWTGKRVWVVGASSGIGRAFTEMVAGAGATVVASSRSQGRLSELVSEARIEGTIRPVLMDVVSDSSVEAAAKEVFAVLGEIDLLLYSAGDWNPVDLPEIAPDLVERQTQVNYLGLVRCVSVVLPSMTRRGQGTIAGVSSASAYSPLPRAEAYGASKAAVSYFLQSLRIDARKRGVKVVTIVPGFVDTPLARRNDFAMPFMVTPDFAAAAMVAGLERGVSEVHFPKRLTLPLKLLGALPRPLKEWVTRRVFKR
ncbi:MAG: SDR family NAD(P)-dependent oxidoreductase [Chloroflexi bacterium]|nr:SDR family NAD(P)-dependent oxidoreductase [Chloroflexota bacterium]MDA1174299.1 SDR family NAD(P)-dependent oxidoreductase [Chloroflexota bacterium]